MDKINMWEIENGLYEQGITAIAGVDEAGRGPLAGPVCAAAVILPEHLEIPGLTDSKKLTYHDVTWSYLSSDSRTVTTIPFEWLGFMIYFK